MLEGDGRLGGTQLWLAGVLEALQDLDAPQLRQVPGGRLGQTQLFPLDQLQSSRRCDRLCHRGDRENRVRSQGNTGLRIAGSECTPVQDSAAAGYHRRDCGDLSACDATAQGRVDVSRLGRADWVR